jgi:tRNA G18 (ribose-2'-O)-methylase SpoU
MSQQDTSNQVPATNYRLGAKGLRSSEPSPQDILKIKRREIYIICDNVLDTYNIGSIFRLADAVAAKCIYLCGQSEIPPNSRIAKASVGTDKWVDWQYVSTAVEAIADLQKSYAHPRGVPGSVKAHPEGEKRIKVIAIEQGKGSIDFRKAEYKEPVAFIVGHETEGVSKEALALADEIVEIPMFGVNRSLNVMVSLAIVLYQVIK